MYQQEIQSGETRATIFLRNTPLPEVEELIFSYLNKGKKEEDTIHSLQELREKQPDTYNFIMNLRDGNHEMRNYVLEEDDE